jgi:hypothetical protein
MRCVLGGLLALSLLPALAGCPDLGACIIESPVHPEDRDWDHCVDGYTFQECDETPDNHFWYSERSCEDVGFTKQCPGEQNTFRKSAYACD